MTFSADIRAGKKNSTKMSICYTNGRWFLHTFNFTVDIDIQVKREWRKPLVKWNTFNTFLRVLCCGKLNCIWSEKFETQLFNYDVDFWECLYCKLNDSIQSWDSFSLWQYKALSWIETLFLKVLLNKIANNSNLSSLKVHLILSNLTQIECICKDKADRLRIWHGIYKK